MRRIRWFHLVGCGLILSLACSERDGKSPPESDAASGAAGEIAGRGGTTRGEGGAAGSSQSGDGGGDEAPPPAGTAGSVAGEAGAPIVRGDAGGEAVGGGATAGETNGRGGAHHGGAAGDSDASGAAGAPPSRVTPEQRALCESICAKQPLTNGFAGAPTVACPNNEGCFEWFCDFVDLVDGVSEFCLEAFTETLACYASMPDEAFECSSSGLFLAEGCVEAEAKWFAACG